MESTCAVDGDDQPKRRDDALDADPTHVPWGYGRDRVTAMVVDPVRLLVYWEVTDDGIADARSRLPPDDRETAVLTLRVYDVTDRIFDGTNAHGHFDRPVDRRQRQWFFDVGRPESDAVVEVGLRAGAGPFVRIARSHRAAFPRSRPADDAPATWITVTEDAWRTGTGPQAAASQPRPSATDATREPTGPDRLGGASEWSFSREGI